MGKEKRGKVYVTDGMDMDMDMEMDVDVDMDVDITDTDIDMDTAVCLPAGSEAAPPRPFQGSKGRTTGRHDTYDDGR